MLTILLMRIIKKRKKDVIASAESPLRSPTPKDVYKLREEPILNLSEREQEQIAIAIAASAALGNLYDVEGQMELRITTNQVVGIQDAGYQYFGRVHPRKLDTTTSEFPLEIFREICEPHPWSVDSEFLRIIIGFGWIGLEMGNLPPLSLRKIDEACSTPEDRKIFAAKISHYVIEKNELTELEKIWNSQCLRLIKFIQNDQGMNAIKDSAPFWLPYFN